MLRFPSKPFWPYCGGGRIKITASAAKRRDIWRLLPGILVSLIALVAIFYFVDLNEVINAFKRADYRYVLPVVLLYISALGLRGMAWRTLLEGEPTFKSVFLSLNAGYLLNNILPFRLGEFGRALLLGRKGLGFWRVFTTILIERAFDLAIVAGLLLGTIPFVWGSNRTRQVSIGVIAIVLLGLVTLHLLARNQHTVLELFEKLSDRWAWLLLLGRQRIQAFFAGLAVLTEFSHFLKVLGWMVFHWFLMVMVQFLLLRAFIPSASFLWVVFGLGVAALGVALPSSPAYVGVLEAAWVSALTLVGVQPGTALAYAFASHLLNIVVTGLIGAYALTSEGLSLGSLYYRIRKETPRQ